MDSIIQRGKYYEKIIYSSEQKLWSGCHPYRRRAENTYHWCENWWGVPTILPSCGNCLVSRSGALDWNGCELKSGRQRNFADIASVESGAQRVLVVETASGNSPPYCYTSGMFPADPRYWWLSLQRHRNVVCPSQPLLAHRSDSFFVINFNAMLCSRRLVT